MQEEAHILGLSTRRTLLLALAVVISGAIFVGLWSARSGSARPLSSEHRTGKPPENPPEVRFRWVLEGNPRMSIRQIGEDHYAVSFVDSKVNFFVFKVEGAAGRTLRFTFEGVPAQHWAAIRPVYGYGDDLSDPAFFEPNQKGQSRWQYMTEMEPLSDSAIAYTHSFEKDSAFVALRVPYTVSYQERWLQSLPKQEGVEIITIGKSAEGRPLTLIKISRGDEQAERENPCILMYAREHGDEPDSSWVVQGAMRFLMSGSREARDLRNRFTFLFIPILDPDAAVNGLHENMYRTFVPSQATAESLAYAEWFERWVDDGKRLDIGLNLHNPEPREYPHLMCIYTENRRGRLSASRALHAVIVRQFQTPYIVRPTTRPGWVVDRLGGWLGYYYGPLPMLYEINSTCPARRLSLTETREMGSQLVLGTTAYLGSSSGRKLLAFNTQLREERAARAAAGIAGENPFDRARSLQWGVVKMIQQSQLVSNVDVNRN